MSEFEPTLRGCGGKPRGAMALILHIIALKPHVLREKADQTALQA